MIKYNFFLPTHAPFCFFHRKLWIFCTLNNWIVHGDATKVNGKTGWIDLGYFNENVPAGGYCLGAFTPNGDFDNIETLEFRLDLKDLYSAETIGKTRTALVTIR